MFLVLLYEFSSVQKLEILLIFFVSNASLVVDFFMKTFYVGFVNKIQKRATRHSYRYIQSVLLYSITTYLLLKQVNPIRT